MKHIMVSLVFLLPALWLAGCGSTSALTTGDNELIRFQQFDRDTGEQTLELVLVDEDSKDFRNLYSEARSNANIKRAPASLLNQLLSTFEDLDYPEMAQPRELGSTPLLKGAPKDRTVKALSVESSRGRWVCLNTDEFCKTEDDFRNFGLMERMFLNAFDSVLSLQVITNDKGDSFFLDEQQRLKEEGERAKEEARRLQQLSQERKNAEGKNP